MPSMLQVRLKQSWATISNSTTEDEREGARGGGVKVCVCVCVKMLSKEFFLELE